MRALRPSFPWYTVRDRYGPGSEATPARVGRALRELLSARPVAENLRGSWRWPTPRSFQPARPPAQQEIPVSCASSRLPPGPFVVRLSAEVEVERGE
jgi:hypothetical protein